VPAPGVKLGVAAEMPTKTFEGSLHVAGVGEGVSSGIADLIVGHAAGHVRWRHIPVAAGASQSITSHRAARRL
jgi:hypothetical protein